MNVRDLRIQLETILTDVLGTYHLPNGATTPAIAVRAWGEGFSAGTVVDGLECLIINDPEPVPIRQYRQEVAADRWTLFLVDWGGEAALQDIAGRLLWAYPGSNAVTVQVPKGVGPKAQMKVEIQTNPAAASYDPDVSYPQRPTEYTVLVDATTSGTIYVGKAPIGIAQNAARWVITKSVYNAAGIRTSRGTASNVTWTGRASHSYS